MFDVTSEYPFVGRWNLPCGKPRWLNLAEMKLYGFKRHQQQPIWN